MLMYIGDKFLRHSTGARSVHIAICGNSTDWHFIVIMKIEHIKRKTGIVSIIVRSEISLPLSDMYTSFSVSEGSPLMAP